MYGEYYASCFFFNDTATTEIYTLSLHDALPISTNRLWRMTDRGDSLFLLKPMIRDVICGVVVVVLVHGNAALGGGGMS